MMGEKNAMLISQHNSFVMVANAALGGGSKNGGPPKPGSPGVTDLTEGGLSLEATVARINAAMRVG